MSAWDQIVAAYSKLPTEPSASPTRTEKACSACQQVKPLSDFYPRKTRGINAVTAKCKPCHIAYSRLLKTGHTST